MLTVPCVSTYIASPGSPARNSTVPEGTAMRSRRPITAARAGASRPASSATSSMATPADDAPTPASSSSVALRMLERFVGARVPRPRRFVCERAARKQCDPVPRRGIDAAQQQAHAPIVQLAPESLQDDGARRIDGRDAAQVEHDEARVRGELLDFDGQALGGAEEQRALELECLDARTVLA